jgi:hypothetical protein
MRRFTATTAAERAIEDAGKPPLIPGDARYPGDVWYP